MAMTAASEENPRIDVPFAPSCDDCRAAAEHVAKGHEQTWHYDFSVANGFATWRAYSIKSLATGLSVRFFRVTIPVGTQAAGSSTGRILISERLDRNFNADAGKIVRKRPVAKSLIRASGEMVTTVTCG